MLQIKDLTFTAWGRRFFDDACVTIADGSKVGLVGRNGVGKSTLFKLILGELSPAAGEIVIPKGGRVATVSQEHAASPTPLLETVLLADTERARLLQDLAAAPPERIGELHARLEDIKAAAAPARASEILGGLGFSTADLVRPMSEFSGGWRMRVALAAALFAEPDLLLLDEPTNYLDLEGALWLEARLKRYRRTALVISHDRELLNASVDAILFLQNGQLALYPGGYDDFERARGERLRIESAQVARQDSERARLQGFVDRFRATASKAAQAQSRLKRLAKLVPVVTTGENSVAPFSLPCPERPLSPPLVSLDGAAVGYDGRPVLRGLTLRLDVEDRIGLLGVNGAGKSTFAKLLAEALPVLSGTIQRAPRLKVGWFNQHQIEAMDPSESPLDMIRRAMPEASEAQRRSRLSQFGLGVDKAETSAGDLSGGERARLLLHLVAMERPHLLILDEPTNHLDIDSRRALTDALNDYEGAVVLITHDRSLMEMVADRLWLAADGAIRPFDGDIEAYAEFVLERARNAARADAARPTGPAQTSAKAARQSAAAARASIAPLKRLVAAIEQRLHRLGETLAMIDSTLSDPTLFTRDPARAIELGRSRAETQSALENAETEWLATEEAYETARAEAGV